MTMILTTSKGRSVDSPFPDDAAATVKLRQLVNERKLGKSEGFALSLIRAFDTNRASKDQKIWIHILAAEGSQAVAQPAGRMIDFGNVNLLFAVSVSKGLHNPRIRLHQLVIRLGYNGKLIVVRQGYDRKVIGTVENNVLHLLACASEDEEKELKAFAADPLSSARVYGTRTGNCCFCGLLLTTPESVGSGYGPVCAERLGLPWADSKGAQLERSKRMLLKLKEQIESLGGNTP